MKSDGEASATRLLHLRFRALPEQLKPVRDAIGAALCGAGCDFAVVGDVKLAVCEACQNIIRHAYCGEEGDVVLEIAWEPPGAAAEKGRLVVMLTDFAPPVDTASICPRALEDLRPGGLGTHIIRAVMDEVAFLPPPEGAGNVLKMVKEVGTPS
ncbi:ATP-binding protein [Telmatospirillum sp. J64-1]|uniref:ATP-binding protein n=1 Tax=Telmatospirillum sp. J64-1 TaxID=2502183 RepID=UPI00115E7D01|nr:ATP-binding protein [Telmatospirillum sp. J64-1]